MSSRRFPVRRTLCILCTRCLIYSERPTAASSPPQDQDQEQERRRAIDVPLLLALLWGLGPLAIFWCKPLNVYDGERASVSCGALL